MILTQESTMTGISNIVKFFG